MQIDSTLLQPVNNETLRTLAAIIREAELKFGKTRLTELIAASKNVLVDSTSSDDTNRFTCYRALLKMAADPNPNWWDKLAQLSAVSRAGSQTNHELVPDKWEASLVAAVSFWAHGHMRNCFNAWHEWTTDVPTFTYKLHTIVRCAARLLPKWALLRWRGRLSRYGGEGDARAQDNLLRVFDRIFLFRFIHAWAKYARGQHQARIHADLKQRSRVLTKLYWHARARQWKRMSRGLSMILRKRLRDLHLRKRWQLWLANHRSRVGARAITQLIIGSIRSFYSAWKSKIKLLVAYEKVTDLVRYPRLYSSLKAWKLLYAERRRSICQQRRAICQWSRFVRLRRKLHICYKDAEDFHEVRAATLGLDRLRDWSELRRTSSASIEYAKSHYESVQLSNACTNWHKHFERQKKMLGKFAHIFLEAVELAFLRAILVSWRDMAVYRKMLQHKLDIGLLSTEINLQRRCLHAWIKIVAASRHSRIRILRNIFQAFRIYLRIQRRQRELEVERAASFASAKVMRIFFRKAQNFVAKRHEYRNVDETSRCYCEHRNKEIALRCLRSMLQRRRYQLNIQDVATAQMEAHSKRLAFLRMRRFVGYNKALFSRWSIVSQRMSMERRNIAWRIWVQAQKRRSHRYATAAGLFQRTELRLRIMRWNLFMKKCSFQRDASTIIKLSVARHRASKALAKWVGAYSRRRKEHTLLWNILHAWILRYKTCAFRSWRTFCHTLQIVTILFEKKKSKHIASLFRRIWCYSIEARKERLAYGVVASNTRKMYQQLAWVEWRKQYRVVKYAKKWGNNLLRAFLKAWSDLSIKARNERAFIARARSYLNENRLFRGIWRRILSMTVSRAMNSWILYLLHRRSRNLNILRGDRLYMRRMCRTAIYNWKDKNRAKLMWRKAQRCDAYLTKCRMWPWLMLSLELSLRHAADTRRALHFFSFKTLSSSLKCWIDFVEFWRYERARMQLLIHAEELHILGAAMFAWRSFYQHRSDLTRRAQVIALVRSERILSQRFRVWSHVYRYRRHCREIADARLRIQASLFRLKLKRMLVTWSEYCTYQAHIASLVQVIMQRNQRSVSSAYLLRWNNKFKEVLALYQPTARFRRIFFARISERIRHRRKFEYACDRLRLRQMFGGLKRLRQYVTSKRITRKKFSFMHHIPWYLKRWSKNAQKSAQVNRRAQVCVHCKLIRIRKESFRIWREELKCRIQRYHLLCKWAFKGWIRFFEENIFHRASLQRADNFIARKAINSWVKATHVVIELREYEAILSNNAKIILRKRQKQTLCNMMKLCKSFKLMRQCFYIFLVLVDEQKAERIVLQNKQREALNYWVSKSYFICLYY